MSKLLRFLVSFVVLILLSAGADADALDARGVEYFETHIRPALIKYCYECHSADNDSVMGDLRLDSRDGLLRGGEHGQAIIPGDSQKSLLMRALRQDEFEMPPEGKLPDEILQRFAEWIEMERPTARRKGGNFFDSDSDAMHWAFQPLRPQSVPGVEDERWPRTAVDHFVLAGLEAAGLTPVAEADRHTLLRRIYFDLWGLPPEPEAIEDFLSDESSDALTRLIDRLLASPLFGQRWGRHWLDVARYAESTGHERNFLFPHAWRYRDYTIASFNADKPFDRFIVEQIAGDMLPADSSQQRDQQHTATGFLAIGPRNLLGGDAQFAMDTVDDQINVTMRSILGLTVSCARCHDHKFDPISTEEYYSLAGIFLSTESLYGTIPGTGGGNNRHPSELIPLGSGGAAKHAAVMEHQKLVAAANKALGKAKNAVKKLNSLPEQALAQKQDELAAAKLELGRTQARLDDLTWDAPGPPPYAMGVRESKTIQESRVRVAGDAARQGEPVARDVLRCCTVAAETPKIPDDASGRMELARWLVDGRHPLTGRVAVNRVWHHLFGRGLVPTVDNFGRNGREPSHPELLDWLAVRFQQDGWSVKRLIRMLMRSRVYQLASTHDSDNHAIDPGNVLLWRMSPRRLDAEAIRDAVLAVSGQLQLPPPRSGSVVAELGDGCLVRQIDSEKLKVEVNYRSVYLPNARYFESEMLQLFDGAAASLVVGDRAETNVPAQALFFLNNEFAIEQARLAAERILSQSGLDDSQRIALTYRFALGREPTSSESERAMEYLRAASSTDHGTGDIVQPWAGLVQAVFAGAEFRYLY